MSLHDQTECLYDLLPNDVTFITSSFNDDRQIRVHIHLYVIGHLLIFSLVRLQEELVKHVQSTFPCEGVGVLDSQLDDLLNPILHQVLRFYSDDLTNRLQRFATYK